MKFAKDSASLDWIIIGLVEGIGEPVAEKRDSSPGILVALDGDSNYGPAFFDVDGIFEEFHADEDAVDG